MTDKTGQAGALPTVYDPTNVEPKWYQFWLDRDYFHAEIEPGRPEYCITIPPPNVTGSLHIGHALCYSIQDVLTRWKRMQGFNTLCLPGTDHAGIATQNMVEKQLAGEGLTRHDLGREKFIEQVWAWKHEYGGRILHQFKTMGFSFDWERERFTMDKGYTKAVIESFIRLFNKGYIYRGARVINWCPRCHTAISDIEVEYIEQHSHLWHLRYPFDPSTSSGRGSGYVIVATTRPETMLGDTAVAVNPNDERYAGLVGRNVILPLQERPIPIVADEFVDMDFGTGAVKVTPAHDPNDFEIGLRHDLPQVFVIGPDGSMTQEAGTRYEGHDRFKAREMVVEDLNARGLLEKIEDHTHSVGTCSRCHTVIEPLLSEQWFCRMKELAKPAIDVVKQEKVKFFPDRYARIYIDWMENIRDWCISRQLWWGHRIPIWKCDDCGGYSAPKTADAKVEACSKCGSANVTQDPDVLDTWFSSALWPFATLGWPTDAPELSYFYPTDVLVTAQEIIYLWVARMIFSSMEYLNEIPFRDVYIYATVLNEEGKRMSKSLGTGVDPLDMIDKYGADALRFALIQQVGMNQDIRFSEKRVEDIRNFANKIWNASRFVLMNLSPSPQPSFDVAQDASPAFGGEGVPCHSDNGESGCVVPSPLAGEGKGEGELADRWILSRLNRTIEAVNKGLAAYQMDDAARALYEFIWSEFCDWYIELAKPRLRQHGPDRQQAQTVLLHVLDTSLRLLHPIMPFLTEEIWQALRPSTSSGCSGRALPHEGKSIMVAEFPKSDAAAFDPEAEAEMDLVMEAVRMVRNLRAELGVAPGKPVDALVVADAQLRPLVERTAESVRSLARVGELRFVDSIDESEKNRYLSAHMPGVDLYVEVAGLIDVDKEIARIDSDLAGIEKELSRSSAKLGNEQFTSRAPAEIVEKERRIVAELADKKTKLEERRAALSK